MRPVYRILVNGDDATDRLRGRLVSLSLVDAAGENADTLSIEIEDDGRLAVPGPGAEIAVRIGHESEGLADMGVYILDSTKLSGPPGKLVLEASGAPFAKSARFKALIDRRTASWEPATLGVLAQTIAKRHGLDLAAKEAVRSITTSHENQTAEGDLSFLRRVAEPHDLAVKASHGRLVMAKRDDFETLSGRDLPVITLTSGDISSWSVQRSERIRYGAVVASWQDTAAARVRQVRVGEATSDAHEIKEIHADQTTAIRAAATKLLQFQRKGATAEVSLPGRSDLASGSPVDISGIRRGLDGLWRAVTVRHNLGAQGWTTSADLEAAKS